MTLNDKQVQDYDVVKAAILDSVRLAIVKYWQKVQATRWTGGLLPRAFTQKLMDWATCWLRPDTQMEG